MGIYLYSFPKNVSWGTSELIIEFIFTLISGNNNKNTLRTSPTGDITVLRRVILPFCISFIGSALAGSRLSEKILGKLIHAEVDRVGLFKILRNQNNKE